MADSPKKRAPLVAPKRNFSDPKPKAKPKIKKSVTPKPTRKKAPRKAKRTKVKSGNPIIRFFRAIFRFFFRIIWLAFSTVAIIGCLVLGTAIFIDFGKLPHVSELMDNRQKGSVTMLDAKGDVFAWRGDQFGGEVTADTVSPHLKNAIIATEDKRFYGHWGISPRGIASAIRINMRAGVNHGKAMVVQQSPNSWPRISTLRNWVPKSVKSKRCPWRWP